MGFFCVRSRALAQRCPVIFNFVFFGKKNFISTYCVFFCLCVWCVCMCVVFLYIFIGSDFQKMITKKKVLTTHLVLCFLISSFMTSLLEGRIIIISRGFDVERIIILMGKKQIIFNNCFCFSLFEKTKSLTAVHFAFWLSLMNLAYSLRSYMKSKSRHKSKSANPTATREPIIMKAMLGVNSNLKAGVQIVLLKRTTFSSSAV